MNLDKIINDKLSRKVYKQIKPRKPYRPSPEQMLRSSIRHVINLIKTGDFDPNKYSHRMQLSLAIKHGYIEKKTLVILKED